MDVTRRKLRLQDESEDERDNERTAQIEPPLPFLCPSQQPQHQPEPAALPNLRARLGTRTWYTQR